MRVFEHVDGTVSAEQESEMTYLEEKPRLALHAIIPRTTANGPGVRYGIWVQGCTRSCPGCINPSTLEPLRSDAPEFRPPSRKGWRDVSTVLEWIASENSREPLEGVSVSGGEPFEQMDALYEFLIGIRKLGLSIIVFTGHTKEELMGEPESLRFFKPSPMMDILVDGAYDRSSRAEGELRGSRNQRVILLTPRYKEDGIITPGPLECIIEPDGSVIFTGFEIPPTAIG